MSKTPALIIPDIYALLEDKKIPEGVDVDKVVEEFGAACKSLLLDAITKGEERSGLRLSAIGKPNRKLWQEVWGIKGEDLDGPTYMKFLFGHLTEAMVLSLVELSGHEVTEKQKRVEVEGVPGHQDCRIDGMLVDVKSASSYAFKKFKYNTLHKEDTFGYIAQLKAYAHQEGDKEFGWLAFDKQNGSLAWLQYDTTNENAAYFKAVNWDVAERVRELKKMLEGPLPSKCFEDIPDGKSGNRKLSSGCAWCPFKSTCWPELRTFSYSGGKRYMTHIVREPNVMEVPDGY